MVRVRVSHHWQKSQFIGKLLLANKWNKILYWQETNWLCDYYYWLLWLLIIHLRHFYPFSDDLLLWTLKDYQITWHICLCVGYCLHTCIHWVIDERANLQCHAYSCVLCGSGVRFHRCSAIKAINMVNKWIDNKTIINLFREK